MLSAGDTPTRIDGLDRNGDGAHLARNAYARAAPLHLDLGEIGLDKQLRQLAHHVRIDEFLGLVLELAWQCLFHLGVHERGCLSRALSSGTMASRASS